MSSFYEWMHQEMYIAVNPVKKIKRIKYEKHEKTPYTDKEVVKLRDTCYQSGDLKMIALMDLCLSTGIRCEEITKIRFEDINFDTTEIVIHGKGQKIRTVYMNQACVEHLKKYIQSKEQLNEYVFSSDRLNARKPSEATIAVMFKKLGEKAGVSQCQIHRFRKYFASSLLKSGCDIVYVQKLLGHAKTETTLIYAKARQEFIHKFY